MCVLRCLVISLALAASACDRPKTGATSKPASGAATAAVVTIQRKYDSSVGYTHVQTSPIVHQLDGRAIQISGGFMYQGREPSRFVKGLALQLAVKTNVPAGSPNPPFKVIVDGGPLAGTTKAYASTVQGVCGYSIFMSEDAFRRLVNAQSAVVTVDDLTVDLSPAERQALSKLVDAMDEWRKPTVDGPGQK